ncbi:MAG: heme o synthase [Bacteroidetes bacterium]|nr:heme o synthase [Bacteroidota bacterium]MDA0937928.1 heme o synthase [Bacteroidota bacterium]MDA1344042.1 heme o synthase [Bacteroidota bacterium]
MKTHTETKSTITAIPTLSDFFQLTKMRLALSVVFSALAGYFLAAPTYDPLVILYLFLGGYAMVGASNAFNQILEIKRDALMKRTQNRPLPSGRMRISSAFVIAALLTLSGAYFLYAINPRTALFGMVSIFLYVCCYTPLKTITPLSVFVGAFPGAIPYMLGWVAYTGKFGIEPGVLFMVQFFWQFPHFWAIGWQLEDDYNKAGFKMLPTGKADQATAFQILFYSMWTIAISILPYTNYTGSLQLSGIGCIVLLLLGAGLLYYGICLMRFKTKKQARQLTFASIGYITLVQIVYVIDKIIFL